MESMIKDVDIHVLTVRPSQSILHHIHPQDLLSLYDILCSETTSADELHTKVDTCTSYIICSMCSMYLINDPNMTLLQSKKWVEDFLALGRHEGYQKRHVTPYMHAIVYYSPTQIRMYGNLRIFSGQGIVVLHPCVVH